MRRFTLAAFAGAALLNGAAFAAQDHHAAAYLQDGALNIKASLDDAGGPARDSLEIGAFYDDDHALDFGAAAQQTDTKLKLSLAFPADDALGAEFLYIDVLEPATGFQLYEIIVRVGDLQVFINDFADELGNELGDAGSSGPDIDDGSESTKGGDPGQNVPIGNPYGDDVLFPAADKLSALFPTDPALDFGNGAATTQTIPVGPSAAIHPSMNPGNDDPSNPDYEPPIGNPYGDDAITPPNPLQDANTYHDPASNPGNGTTPGSGNPFAPGDGDLGDLGNADDFTMTSAPSLKNQIPIIEPSLAVNTGDGGGPTLGTAYPIDEELATDCNGNGTADHLEIANDPGLDMDNDGRIDRCTAQGDLDNDGVVGVLDLVALIMNWGNCLDSSCEGDLTVDGIVNEDDIAVLFNHWTN